MSKKSFDKIWDKIAAGYFVACILFLCFFAGVIIGHNFTYPYEFFRGGWAATKEALTHSAKPPFVCPARYPGEGVVAYDPARTFPGLTLLTGFWPDGKSWNLEAHLIDLSGKTLHKWRMNPRDVWSEDPHRDRARGSKDDKYETNIHGAWVEPNGDILFNFEHYSLVKMDANSKVIWKLPYRTHHSVFLDDKENIWVPGIRWREQINPEYLGVKPPFIEDMILEVSPDGKIKREISVLKVIHDSGYEGLLRERTSDLLHLNDVEVLTPDKAKAFPSFKTGDIMISLRNIHTILVVDGVTERIKWSLTHPFIRQHDPDFTDDGHIMVFNNYLDEATAGHGRGGTRILRIDPASNEVTVLYGGKPGQYFHTQYGGKQQLLPNGDLLITEARAGRVFEVTPAGETVWNWLAPRWGRDGVPEILDGLRYEAKYLKFLDLKSE